MHGKVIMNETLIYRPFNGKHVELFKKFQKLYFDRYPDDRPNIVELQNHPFFKQGKRTTLAENFSSTGIDKYNCTKLNAGKL